MSAVYSASRYQEISLTLQTNNEKINEKKLTKKNNEKINEKIYEKFYEKIYENILVRTFAIKPAVTLAIKPAVTRSRRKKSSPLWRAVDEKNDPKKKSMFFIGVHQR